MTDEHLHRARELYRSLVRIIETVQGLDLRELEGQPAQVIFETLAAPVKRALVDSRRTLAEVLDCYERASDPSPPALAPDRWNRGFDLDVDTLVRQQPSAGRIADLAFMAGMELRQKQEAVERLDPDKRDGWTLIEELDSARRRIAKSLTAVATVLCQAEGLEPKVGFASELERSLEVRRQYARLRRSIGHEESLSDDELHPRLRGVGTRIAMLIGRWIYPELRVSDRRALRELQARLLAWLRDFEPTEERRMAGRRLWQDLAGFASVLVQVNRRQELLEHDAHVVTIACGALYAGSGKEEVPEGLLEHLRALEGLDERIDALLAGPVVEAARWRGPLIELARRFGRHVPGDSRPPMPPGFDVSPWSESV